MNLPQCYKCEYYNKYIAFGYSWYKCKHPKNSHEPVQRYDIGMRTSPAWCPKRKDDDDG